MLLLEYYYYYYYYFWSCSCSNLCFCTCVRIGMLIGRINHKRTRAHVYCNVVVQCVYGENGDPARSRPCDWFDIVSLLAIPPRRPPAGGERRRRQWNDTARTRTRMKANDRTSYINTHTDTHTSIYIRDFY